MNQRFTIALLVETSNAYARAVLGGVVAYTREHQLWSLRLVEQRRGDPPPTWFAQWRGDGIIARIENQRIADAVAAAGVPTVDVSAARKAPELPWVETDDRAIAKLAFTHLAERGFRHFGFCSVDGFNWSKWRGERFASEVRKAGFKCHTLNSPPVGRSGRNWDQDQQEMIDWLAQLPKPVGVMACYDVRAQQLLDACRRAELAVPDEVAVIGVDNDELLCNLSDPPLSSVIPDAHRTGYEAAHILDRMMRGRKPPRIKTLIAPRGVATRLSTDVRAIDDWEVSNAVRYIRAHACEGINVEDVLQQVPLSRRVLENRFKKLLGRTPHEEIVRLQLDRIKQLLRETELQLSVIAQRAGFSHPEYLNVVFKKKLGMTPGEYRAAYRDNSTAGRNHGDGLL